MFVSINDKELKYPVLMVSTGIKASDRCVVLATEGGNSEHSFGGIYLSGKLNKIGTQSNLWARSCFEPLRGNFSLTNDLDNGEIKPDIQHEEKKEELPPCPYCGSRPKIAHNVTGCIATGCVVYCTNSEKNCVIEGTRFEKDKWIQMWEWITVCKKAFPVRTDRV